MGKSAARVAAEMVAPLFALNGWTWAGRGRGDEFVPTTDDIEAEFLSLEKMAQDMNSSEVAAGRLRWRRGDADNCCGDQYLLDLVEVNPYSGEPML